MCVQVFSVSHAKVKLVAEPIDMNGNKNQIMNVISRHSIEIENDSGKTQDYNYYFKICAQNQGCNDYHNKIKLNPDSKFKDSKNVLLQAMYRNQGNYQIIATSFVSSEQVKEITNYGSLWIR